MIEPPGKPPRPATLDDLAALNREIAALVRAGLPLEESLGHVAEDLGRGPGELASRLQRETAAGKSLADAIAAQGDALPPAYRTIVAAGLKAGRLPAALEGYAESAARIADLRRIAAHAAAYPLIVIVLAIIMLAAGAAILIPRFEWLELGNRVWAAPLAMSRRAALWWIVATPLVAAALAAVWWRRSHRAAGATGRRNWTRWIPGAQRAAELSGDATFTDLLGVLIASRVPLVEALPLAASASGRPELETTAAAVSAQLTAGRPLAAGSESLRGLPPLARLALASSPNDRVLVASLGEAAAIYRERATAWVSHMALVAPIVATLLVGAVVISAYALLLFQPYIAVLNEAASWH